MDLIELLTAVLNAEADAIDAYNRHRGHGPCINYPGQNPDHYSEHDSCSEHIATADAVRFHRPDTGHAMVAAFKEILEEIQRELADDDANETALWFLSTLAKGYGIDTSASAQIAAIVEQEGMEY